MTPEFELLVRCCGIARNLPVHGTVLQSCLPGGFDESHFVGMAIQHKTAATAMLGLKKMGISLDPKASKKLRSIVLRNNVIRQLILEDAYAIFRVLRLHNISALALKGFASSIELYNNPFVREYTDLDILVNLPNVDTLVPLMAELGYRTKDYHPADDPARMDSWLVQKTHHVVFQKEDRPFHVEIHDRTGWENELFGRANIDEVFSRAIVLETSYGTIPAPEMADHALLILAHGTQHAWCLLHWTMDAAVLLCRTDEDFHRVCVARIDELGMQRQLKLICGLVLRLYPITLSPTIESAILGERSLLKAENFAYMQLMSGGSEMPSIRNIVAFQVRYSFPLLHGLRAKAASFFKLAKIPPKDIDALPLPQRLYFLYIPLRPFFIALRRVKRYREKQAARHA